MNKMNMEQGMLVNFWDLNLRWSSDVFDACERFLRVAALMRKDDYLGFEVVAMQDRGYQVWVFANANARISLDDYKWIFGDCASVEDLPELPKKKFEEEKRYLYVVKRKGFGNATRFSNQNGEDFNRRLEEFADMLGSHNASLRIVARAGRKNGRGAFYLSLPERMSLSMEASVVRMFPGTVISEVQGCNEKIPKTNWLTLTQMIDGMMGMMGLLKKHYDLAYPWDDELCDADLDKFDVIDEGDASHGEENGSISGYTLLENLYGGLRSEECPIPGDTSIDELEFSARTHHCLKMHGIKTAATLFALTEVDLHNIRLNEDGMWEIRDKRKALKSMSRRDKAKDRLRLK